MEVLEFPNGICDRHGPKLSVNGIPCCVKCVAEAERAQRAPGPVVTVEDPGHDAMERIVPDGKHAPRPGSVVSNGSVAQAAPSVAHQLGAICAAIYGLPMPKSLKQYKRFQKIQALIAQALQEEQENADAD